MLLLIAQYDYAQNTIDTNVVTISLGPSFPLGYFSAKDFNDQFLGKSLPEAAINFSFTHKLYKNLGVTAMLYGQLNGLDKTLGRQYGQAWFYDDAGDNTHSHLDWSFDKKSLYAASFLVGLSEEFFTRKDGRFSITAKALAGITFAKMPGFNGNGRSDSVYAIVIQNKAAGLGFSYFGSIGVKYKCSKAIYLLCNIDYFGAPGIDFRNVRGISGTTTGGFTIPGFHSLNNSNGPPRNDIYNVEEKQRMSSLNVNVGVGFKL